jgi:hypothetical protein
MADIFPEIKIQDLKVINDHPFLYGMGDHF